MVWTFVYFLPALTKPKFKAVIENYFNKAASNDSLASLNTAFASEGAFVHIPKHKAVEKTHSKLFIFQRAVTLPCFCSQGI